jgi:hypothetical protein
MLRLSDALSIPVTYPKRGVVATAVLRALLELVKTACR